MASLLCGYLFVTFPLEIQQLLESFINAHSGVTNVGVALGGN